MQICRCRSSEEAWWALVEESKKHFQLAIAEFEALRDDANVALVVNNL